MLYLFSLAGVGIIPFAEMLASFLTNGLAMTAIVFSVLLCACFGAEVEVTPEGGIKWTRELFVENTAGARQVLAATAAGGGENVPAFRRDISRPISEKPLEHNLCQQIAILSSHEVPMALKLLLGLVDDFNSRLATFLERIHGQHVLAPFFRGTVEEGNSDDESPIRAEEEEAYHKFLVGGLPEKMVKPLDMQAIYHTWLVPEGLLAYDTLTFFDIQQFIKCAQQNVMWGVAGQVATKSHIRVLKDMFKPIEDSNWSEKDLRVTTYQLYFDNRGERSGIEYRSWSHVFHVFDLFLRNCFEETFPMTLRGLLENDESYKYLMDTYGTEYKLQQTAEEEGRDEYALLWEHIMKDRVRYQDYDDLLAYLQETKSTDYRAVTNILLEAFEYDSEVIHFPPFAHYIQSRFVDETQFPSLPLTINTFTRDDIPVRSGTDWNFYDIMATVSRYPRLSQLVVRFSAPPLPQVLNFPGTAEAFAARGADLEMSLKGVHFPKGIAIPGSMKAMLQDLSIEFQSHDSVEMLNCDIDMPPGFEKTQKSPEDDRNVLFAEINGFTPGVKCTFQFRHVWVY